MVFIDQAQILIKSIGFTVGAFSAGLQSPRFTFERIRKIHVIAEVASCWKNSKNEALRAERLQSFLDSLREWESDLIFSCDKGGPIELRGFDRDLTMYLW